MWPLSHGLQAAIECSDDGATLQVPSAVAPPAVSSQDFSVFVWIHPTQIGGACRSVLYVDHVLHIHQTGTGSMTCRLLADDDPSTFVEAEAPLPPATDQWVLVAVSRDVSADVLTVYARSESSPTTSGTVSTAGFAAETEAGPVGLGATPECPALVGGYDLLAFRDHAITQQDFDDVWDSRRFAAPFDLDNTGSGGAMNGRGGCELLLNHGCFAEPVKGPGFAGPAEAGIIGQPVTGGSVLAYFPALSTNFRATYGASTAGFTYVSHHEPPYAGFFQRDLPGLLPSSEPVPAIAPHTRALADNNPCGLTRVVVSSNSRAVRRREQLGSTPSTVVGEPFTGSYAEGFWRARWDHFAGILFVPAVSSPSAFPGFFSFENPPASTGNTVPIGNSTPAGPADFTRFWTGSSSANALGPGTGTILLPGGSFALSCRPDGLMEAEHPLYVRAYVLAFPGASDITWRSVQADQQSGGSEVLGSIPGVDEFTTSLDTTRHAVTLDADDEITGASGFYLDGDLTSDILKGDACFAPAVPAPGSISIVSDVVFDAGRTRVTLETPLGITPEIGDELLFGPWQHVELLYNWPALAPGDPLTWRGIRVEAADDNKAGFPLFAFSAWRPHVDGFAFAQVGWGGNGYTPQIESALLAPTLSWISLLNADVWIQIPAQQHSDPPAMSDFADLVTQSLPTADLVWAGGMAHGSSTGIDRPFDDWHAYILDNAASHGAVGVSLLEHPGFGTFIEQAADGLRIDAAHITARGNLALADAWLDALREAARIEGDADNNGVVEVPDITYVIFRLGNSGAPGEVEGDVNGDGVVDINDVTYVLFRLDEDCQ